MFSVKCKFCTFFHTILTYMDCAHANMIANITLHTPKINFPSPEYPPLRKTNKQKHKEKQNK